MIEVVYEGLYEDGFGGFGVLFEYRGGFVRYDENFVVRAYVVLD